MATRKVLKKILLNGEAYNIPGGDDYVDLSNNQTVGGVKTFTDEPVLPAKSSAATSSTTAPATEKQVYDVADSLSTLDAAAVKLTGNQTIAGTKTFSTEPVLPAKDTAVGTSKTAPATEYQVKAVKDAIPTNVIHKNDFDTGTSETAGLTTAKDVADYVKAKVTSVYVYKGTVSTYADLPSTGQVTGDTYNVETAHTTAPVFPAGANLAWNGTAWDVLGGTVDLSGYVDKSSNETVGGVKTFSSEPVLPSKTSDATNDGTKPATEAQVYKKADSTDIGNATITFNQAGAAIGTLTTNQSSNGTLDFKGNKFVTQTEYDNLPASKATDGNTHFIYETITE